MAQSLKIISRSQAADTATFENSFAGLPDRAQLATSQSPKASSSELWMQLIRYGDKRKCEFWLASSEHTGDVLARIGADIPEARPAESSIGFFECIDSDDGRAAGEELIRTALQWLADNRAQGVVAPMDFNSWFNYRFKIRNPEDPATIDKSWEPNAPDTHRQLFMRCGFQEFIHFASLSYELGAVEHWKAYLKKIHADYEAVITQGYVFRPFEKDQKFISDLKDVFTLSNIAFADNPMFEKIPFELFAGSTTALARKSKMDASRICTSPDGQIAGFAFCFIENDELIYKTVAVHPDHRSKGIANALTYEISNYCFENNILKTTGALIRSGNRSERIGQSHGQFAQPTQTHKYVLLRRDIP